MIVPVADVRDKGRLLADHFHPEGTEGVEDVDKTDKPWPWLVFIRC